MKTTMPTIPVQPDQKTEEPQNQQISPTSLVIDFDYMLGLACLIFNFATLLALQKKLSLPLLEVGSFVITYLVACFYTAWLLAKGKIRMLWKKQPNEFLAHRILLGFIWLVSCFSLNLSMSVFNTSAPWLSAAIIICVLAGVVFTLEEWLPQAVKNVVHFLIASSTVLWCYYALYLIRLYPVSLLALMALGISVHSFIPLLISITYINILVQKWKIYRRYLLAGILAPLLFIVGFSIKWNRISSEISHKTNVIAAGKNNALPDWILLGQSVGSDWVSKKIIIGDLAYQMPTEFFSFGPTMTNLGQLAQHDPLVFIASFFMPKPALDQQDRIKLLNVIFDGRHYTQERLWSGSDLVTSHVATEAKIYPEFRLAYTEKTISIESRARQTLMQEEALYTFHLPEGSVVSSLSLWIDGVEQKSYLTTQAKADLAYKTIVGVETRDPSVIHWQEGNTLKIKVFPCTSEEERKFKIGITSPLKFENNQLVYENAWFNGPATSQASETIKLDFTQEISGLKLPFKSEKAGSKLVFNGRYQSDWDARFNAPPVSDAGFTFNGKSYSMLPVQAVPESFAAKAIYLDINSSWSEEEFDEIFYVLKNKPVYVFDQNFKLLNHENREAIFEKLSAFNYSLFPVHLVADRENALLITKGTAISPNVKDLSGSHFSNALSQDKILSPLKTLNLSTELSPYLKTLQELRIIRSEERSLTEIRNLLSRNQFPANAEANESMLKIGNSGLVIVESNVPVKQNAPDHLLRLFAYNHIMKQAGRHYLDKSFQSDSVLQASLVSEASLAHIVTPVSSMIVLESQKDYDRFDIKKSKNSLDNASLKSSGAVPEPHEWALIVLFALLAGYYTFRNYAR
ncbi:XrtN system VIT domain-containing protein [Dyadobacter luticola]|uniref:XrtN system VIT domain-containing protein n=1 Tax=Dyadobacter luticola TaxID=1979387 RepID=A0A5R9KRL7_9BACT|nr:XrtN system VIT domain-containing protein [Dyadobacter luticola]TLU98912.1 XrtN system VIT domain-containing protein [Dyadobacter luticola]